MKIYHNDQCSKSNCALDLMKQKDIALEVVDYIQNPLSKEEVTQLLSMLAMKPFDLIRKNEPLFKARYVGKTFTDEQWIDLLVLHPELIERPIIVKDGKAVIARPAERIFELL